MGEPQLLYDPEFALLEGVVGRLVKAPLNLLKPQSFDRKWAVLTPTNLLFFKDANAPAPGAKPKLDIYLGEQARVEPQDPATSLPKMSAKDVPPFLFAIMRGEMTEAVLGFTEESDFQEWVTAVDQQSYLTQYAEREGLGMDMDGNFLNANSERVATKAEVLAAAQADVVGEAYMDDAGSQYSEDAAVVTGGEGSGGGGLPSGLSFYGHPPESPPPPPPPNGSSSSPIPLPPAAPDASSASLVPPPPLLAVDSAASMAPPPPPLPAAASTDARDGGRVGTEARAPPGPPVRQPPPAPPRPASAHTIAAAAAPTAPPLPSSNDAPAPASGAAPTAVAASQPVTAVAGDSIAPVAPHTARLSTTNAAAGGDAARPLDFASPAPRRPTPVQAEAHGLTSHEHRSSLASVASVPPPPPSSTGHESSAFAPVPTTGQPPRAPTAPAPRASLVADAAPGAVHLLTAEHHDTVTGHVHDGSRPHHASSGSAPKRASATSAPSTQPTAAVGLTSDSAPGTPSVATPAPSAQPVPAARMPLEVQPSVYPTSTSAHTYAGAAPSSNILSVAIPALAPASATKLGASAVRPMLKPRQPAATTPLKNSGGGFVSHLTPHTSAASVTQPPASHAAWAGASMTLGTPSVASPPSLGGAAAPESRLPMSTFRSQPPTASSAPSAGRYRSTEELLRERAISAAAEASSRAAQMAASPRTAAVTTVSEASPSTSSSAQPLLSTLSTLPPREVPMREVRRIFDTFARPTNGIVAASKLPALTSALGMPMDESDLATFAAQCAVAGGFDAPGNQFGRPEFLSWWRRYVTMKTQVAEAVAARNMALAPTSPVLDRSPAGGAAARALPFASAANSEEEEEDEVEDAEAEAAHAKRQLARTALPPAVAAPPAVTAPTTNGASSGVGEGAIPRRLQFENSVAAALPPTSVPAAVAAAAAIEPSHSVAPAASAPATSSLAGVDPLDALEAEINSSMTNAMSMLRTLANEMQEERGLTLALPSAHPAHTPPQPAALSSAECVAGEYEWLRKYGAPSVAEEPSLLPAAAPSPFDMPLTPSRAAAHPAYRADGGFTSPILLSTSEGIERGTPPQRAASLLTNGVGGGARQRASPAQPDATALSLAVSAAFSAAQLDGAMNAADTAAGAFVPLPRAVPLAVSVQRPTPVASASALSLVRGTAEQSVGLAHVLTTELTPCGALHASTAGGEAVPAGLRAVDAERPLVMPFHVGDAVHAERARWAATADSVNWNAEYQAALELPVTTFKESVQRATRLTALLGRFDAAASAAARTIVDEMMLPAHLKSLPPMGAAAMPDVYYHHGICLRVAAGGTAPGAEDFSPAGYAGLLTSADMVQRKVAGHELRSLRALQAAYLQLALASAAGVPGEPLPPLRVCSVLTSVIDCGGFRLYAMAVPPMDDDATLVAGKRDDAAGTFVLPPAHVAASLRRVGRTLNLKPHAVEALVAAAGAAGGMQGSAPDGSSDGAVRPVVIPLSFDTQAHLCGDGRLYALNVSRLMPADLSDTPTPHAAALPSVCLLRPEFVAAYDTALSSDAFRSAFTSPAPSAGSGSNTGTPPDAQANDLDAARASQYLVSRVLPSFVERAEACTIPLTHSAEVTDALHAAGINVRYLGRVATLATSSWLQEVAEVEMVARVVKHIVNKHLRRCAAALADSALTAPQPDSNGHMLAPTSVQSLTARSHVAVLAREQSAHVAATLNLVLGHSNEAVAFWRDVLIPAVYAKFGYHLRWASTWLEGAYASQASAHVPTVAASRLPPLPLHKPALAAAVAHHCNIDLVRDALPALSAVPSIATRPYGASADTVALSLSAAAKALPPSVLGLAPVEVDASTSALATFDATPYLAPIAYVTLTPGLGSTTKPSTLGPSSPGFLRAAPVSAAGSVVPSVLSANGATTSALSAFDFSSAHPILSSDILPLRPRVSSMRPVPFGAAPEELVLRFSAAAYGGAGRLEAATDALHIRLALLTCLATGGEDVPATLAQQMGSLLNGDASALELASVLIDCARVALASRALPQLHTLVNAALAHAPGRHILAAHALLLRAQALLLQGAEADALAVFAQAAAAAAAHCGKNHPVPGLLATAFGHTLAVCGRPAAGACLCEQAADASARVLGSRHMVVAHLNAAVGRLLFSAASLASADTLALSSSSDAVRVYASVYVRRAMDAFERALFTWDAAAASGADVRIAVADSSFFFACAAVAEGKLSAALAAALRSLDACRSLSAEATPALLRALQLMAALCDRLDKPHDAVRHLEALAVHMKAVKQEAALGVLQRITRHIIRLTFRAIPTNHRALLQQLISLRPAEPEPSALAYVVRALFAALRPSDFVRSLCTRLLAACAAGCFAVDPSGALVVVAPVETAADEPPLLDQLTALVSILSVRPATPGAGADLGFDLVEGMLSAGAFSPPASCVYHCTPSVGGGDSARLPHWSFLVLAPSLTPLSSLL